MKREPLLVGAALWLNRAVSAGIVIAMPAMAIVCDVRSFPVAGHTVAFAAGAVWYMHLGAWRSFELSLRDVRKSRDKLDEAMAGGGNRK